MQIPFSDVFKKNNYFVRNQFSSKIVDNDELLHLFLAINKSQLERDIDASSSNKVRFNFLLLSLRSNIFN